MTLKDSGKTTLEFFISTRDRMISLARKNQSYDDFVNTLIDKVYGKKGGG